MANLKRVTTDGRIMSGAMQENSEPPVTFHCIVHQPVLCSKVLRWNSA
jgi:hypothetical protein